MYCLDANSFIEPWNALYPEDTFPSFWKKLDTLISKGLVVAPEEVGKEIEAGQDELSKWVKARKAMFQPPNQQVQVAVGQIVNAFNTSTLVRIDPGVLARIDPPPAMRLVRYAWRNAVAPPPMLYGMQSLVPAGAVGCRSSADV